MYVMRNVQFYMCETISPSGLGLLIAAGQRTQQLVRGGQRGQLSVQLKYQVHQLNFVYNIALTMLYNYQQYDFLGQNDFNESTRWKTQLNFMVLTG